MPPHRPRLQTSSEKFRAAPTSRRRDRHTHRERLPPPPSPLITCAPFGVDFHAEHRRNEANPTPYRFHPIRHLVFELHVQNLKAAARQMPSFDMFMQSVQQQKTVVPRQQKLVLVDPVPIRLKVSPQVRRLRIKRDRREGVVGRRKMKLPERGQFHRRTPETRFIREILFAPYPKVMAVEPKRVAIMLLQRILLPKEAAGPEVREIIALRRVCLTRENFCVVPHIIEGTREDDPNVPAVFKMFDNNEQGIPASILAKRGEHATMTDYQFRMLAKRFAIGEGDTDYEERFLLGEILGMEEEQVQRFLLKLHFEKELAEKPEKYVRALVENTYKEALREVGEDLEGLLLLLATYHQVMVPNLNELYAKAIA
uniref:Uncharacterized protein n=1 Tax=Caenorhabditis japonica TaxID=281687 RepID=A0A8R1DQQ9_CAEJA